MVNKFFVISFISFGILLSCSNNETKGKKEVVSTIAASQQSEKELEEALKKIEQEEQNQLNEKKKTSTTLKFDKIKHDFGNVKPDSENSCKFKVTNTGNNPLIIENVEASCGCTTPHKPEKPIPPGKSDFIEVGFHPKPGQVNEIIKTVTVTANTIPEKSEISIRAFVK